MLKSTEVTNGLKPAFAGLIPDYAFISPNFAHNAKAYEAALKYISFLEASFFIKDPGINPLTDALAIMGLGKVSVSVSIDCDWDKELSNLSKLKKLFQFCIDSDNKLRNKKRGMQVEFEPIKYELLKILTYLRSDQYTDLHDFLFVKKVPKLFFETIFERDDLYQTAFTYMDLTDTKVVSSFKSSLINSLIANSGNAYNPFRTSFSRKEDVLYSIQKIGLYGTPDCFKFESPGFINQKYDVNDVWFRENYAPRLFKIFNSLDK